MSQHRKFLFFYLDTGAGHKSSARVLEQAILDKYPDCEIKLVNGFMPHRLGHFIYERGYNASLSFLRGSYPLTYDVGFFRPFITTTELMIMPETIAHLKKLILKEQPTDIVNFHFALTPHLKRVVKHLPFKVNLTVMVTDPFTAHPFWFYEKNMSYLVFSQQLKDYAVKKCNVPEKNITVVPFLLNKKFKNAPTKEEILSLREKHGYDPNKKIVLLVGGGEGLPGATGIINQCILKKANFTVIAVCGRDKLLYQRLSLVKLANPNLDLRLYEFVTFLDELVKLSDCAVVKAGPATLMEVISCRKPTIICRYIHNQELGNMHYAVDNKVGYFIQKSNKIYDKINELLNDKDFEAKMQANFDKLSLDTDTSKVADLLLAK